MLHPLETVHNVKLADEERKEMEELWTTWVPYFAAYIVRSSETAEAREIAVGEDLTAVVYFMLANPHSICKGSSGKISFTLMSSMSLHQTLWWHFRGSVKTS